MTAPVAVSSLLGKRKDPETRTCAEHGDYTAQNLIADRWSGCPACTKRQVEAEALKRAEKDAADAQERWRRRIGSAGIPPRFQERTLDNFIARNDKQQRALDFARDYAATFAKALETGRSAIFTGKPGTGKTHLAAAIGMSLLADKRKVLFTSVLRAIRRVKDSWRRESDETESDAIRFFAEPDLLILDEVGIQFGSETEKMLLFDVLNERYEHRRPVILLTNLPVKDVQTFLGERVMDRLREDGGEAIIFDWDSYRGNPHA